MSPAEHFPLYHPPGAQRAFGSDDATRRFAKVAQLEQGSRVLVLGCGPEGHAAVLLAQELKCSVVAVDTDEALVSPIRERVRTQGLADRIEVRRVAPDALGMLDGPFHGILVPGRVQYPLDVALRTFRPLLGKRGRVGFTFPARVGRFTPKPVLDFWEKRLGAPLLLPRELLQALENAGFEPESVESLHDTELDALYKDMEAHLPEGAAPESATFREELALHREHNQKPGVSYAFAVGRRKEPGEKPPASRDRG
ncbi:MULTISPECIES: cyclopropane-fatty-acyl-phospholipid synthase family protein [unclassified Corallococcus]|uniref:SAM-dependent methyltransferase n=1 Tax=Corallococcus TaxID=83461 RepID=UPI001CBC0D7A|nr:MULTISPECIES: methyltransferase domain-containing protein [unclassified Corallococcus]MBZ4335098.1 SAM-dependent methyltransferase [Corallococcus sp. AS-1-12]MBZ4376079.1 SAM-dependent methyltransferase [Corallococcus sp. AS-1-6]